MSKYHLQNEKEIANCWSIKQNSIYEYYQGIIQWTYVTLLGWQVLEKDYRLLTFIAKITSQNCN